MQNVNGNKSYKAGMTLKLSGVWTLVWVLTFFWPIVQASVMFMTIYFIPHIASVGRVTPQELRLQ